MYDFERGRAVMKKLYPNRCICTRVIYYFYVGSKSLFFSFISPSNTMALLQAVQYISRFRFNMSLSMVRSQATTVLRQPARMLGRHLQTDARSEKRYVRIAGPAAYATRRDVTNFLKQHDTSPRLSTSLVQGQSDIFQNHSVWLFDAGDQKTATTISSRISGRILGLKLVRAVPVDDRIFSNMVSAPSRGDNRRNTLRRRLNIIAPKQGERGRVLLVTNLPHLLQPRLLWSFFASYDVTDVRHLRRSGVACVVFTTEREAARALRERSNFSLQGQQTVMLKIHE